MNQPPQATMDTLFSQCRGEMAALDAYDRALKKFADQPEEPILLKIRNGHDDAVSRLGAMIEGYGLKMPSNPGPQNRLASIFLRLQALVNDEVPIEVLQKGEETGIEGYETLRADPSLPEHHALLDMMLARTREHHAALQHIRDHIRETPPRPMTAW